MNSKELISRMFFYGIESRCSLLIEYFQPFLNKYLKNYPKDKQEDLYQEAMIGLYELAKKGIQPDVKKPKEYIKQYLRNKINQANREDTGLIRLPYNVIRLIKKYRKIPNREDLTDIELLNELECTPSMLKYVKQYNDVEYVSYEELRENVHNSDSN